MVNAFSFCLFGPVAATNERVETDKGLIQEVVKFIPGGYYDGLDENIRLIGRYFPGWRVYVYLGVDVPEWFETFLQTTYPYVRTQRTGVLGHENTVHRFFAIDEPDVDVVFFRDADSRVHWKDRWAVRNFMSQTVYRAHIIRDHPDHSTRIAAGTWGLRKGVLKQSLRSLFDAWTPVFAGSGDGSDVRGYGIDQNFLESVIYFMILPSLLVTHSNHCINPGETAVEFPFEWTNDMYVGRIEGKPITENFWLRERETPPPQIRDVVIPGTNPPPPPERRTPFPFLRHSISGNAS
jgi:hypothetical protein